MVIEKSTADKKSTNSNKDIRRLPCRGCTEQCKNYDVCDGKLWRINDAEKIATDNI